MWLGGVLVGIYSLGIYKSSVSGKGISKVLNWG